MLVADIPVELSPKREWSDGRKGEFEALTIQSIYMVQGGALSTILPILMREEGLSIQQIGIVYSLQPFLFQITRLFLGALSDFVGRKPFYFLNGVGSALSLLTYYLARTPIGFAVGRLLGAVQAACIWAVNRAYFLEQRRGSAKSLFNMRAVTAIFAAIGNVLAGFLVAKILYRPSLLVLLPLSAAMMILSLILPETVKRRSPEIKDVFRAIDLRGKGSIFLAFVALLCVPGFSVGIVRSYVVPLFLKSMNLPIERIGMLLSLQSLASGITLYLLSLMINYKNFLLLSGIYSFVGVLVFGFAKDCSVLPLILVLGSATGAIIAAYEMVTARIAGKRSYGADIGLLMLGFHGGNTLSQAVSGFLISSVGYPSLFLLSGIGALIFSVFAQTRLSAR